MVSTKQGTSISIAFQILLICVFIVPWVFLSLQSVLLIKQIQTLDKNYLLRYGTITGHHKEDSALGDQAKAIVYWVIFQVDNEFTYKQRVSFQTYSHLKIGHQISVQISPNNPRLCRAEIE